MPKSLNLQGFFLSLSSLSLSLFTYLFKNLMYCELTPTILLPRIANLLQKMVSYVNNTWDLDDK